MKRILVAALIGATIGAGILVAVAAYKTCGQVNQQAQLKRMV